MTYMIIKYGLKNHVVLYNVAGDFGIHQLSGSLNYDVELFGAPGSELQAVATIFIRNVALLVGLSRGSSVAASGDHFCDENINHQWRENTDHNNRLLMLRREYVQYLQRDKYNYYTSTTQVNRSGHRNQVFTSGVGNQVTNLGNQETMKHR